MLYRMLAQKMGRLISTSTPIILVTYLVLSEARDYQCKRLPRPHDLPSFYFFSIVERTACHRPYWRTDLSRTRIAKHHQHRRRLQIRFDSVQTASRSTISQSVHGKIKPMSRTDSFTINADHVRALDVVDACVTTTKDPNLHNEKQH